MQGRITRHHEKLTVWQDAMDLVEEVYRFTSVFPDTERFGLASQMQRASTSIPSNIAEGAARESRKDYLRFPVIARGSLVELETQVKIAQRLGYQKEPNALLADCNRVFAKLSALINTVKLKLN